MRKVGRRTFGVFCSEKRAERVCQQFFIQLCLHRDRKKVEKCLVLSSKPEGFFPNEPVDCFCRPQGIKRGWNRDTLFPKETRPDQIRDVGIACRLSVYPSRKQAPHLAVVRRKGIECRCNAQLISDLLMDEAFIGKKRGCVSAKIQQ
ncbi:MAG: hypothetical protein RIR26_1211 [Pseudomonadota bacterium]